MTEWTKQLETDSNPIFWLPPHADYWGRSLSFATLLRDLSEQEPAGLVLLARDGFDRWTANSWRKRFGKRERQAALFDRCLAITNEAPRSLEIVLKPNGWCLVLLHAPDLKSGYPLPVGYISGDKFLVHAFEDYFAKLATSESAADPVLWHREEENPTAALRVIDEALRIETVS